MRGTTALCCILLAAVTAFADDYHPARTSTGRLTLTLASDLDPGRYRLYGSGGVEIVLPSGAQAGEWTLLGPGAIEGCPEPPVLQLTPIYCEGATPAPGGGARYATCAAPGGFLRLDGTPLACEYREDGEE